MSRILTLVAVVLAVGLGAWTKAVPRALVTQGPAAEAVSWAAENGLRVERTDNLTTQGVFVTHRFLAPNGCRIAAVPLGNADESLSSVTARLSEAERLQSRLLLNSVGPMPETALGIQVKRFMARITEGRSPQPVLIYGLPGCQYAASGGPLSAWPAP